MQALLAYAEEQMSRKAAAALRRQARLERARKAARACQETSTEAGRLHRDYGWLQREGQEAQDASDSVGVLGRLQRRYGQMDARGASAAVPSIAFLPFGTDEVEPLQADTWEVIDLSPAGVKLDPARPGLYVSGQPHVPDADAYRAALRAAASKAHAYGKVESWAVVMLVNGDVFRWVYKGSLSRLRQYVADELSAMLSQWAGIRPEDEIGMPLRIERQ